MDDFQASLGPQPLSDGRWLFRVWAPGARAVDLHLLDPRDRIEAMVAERNGYWTAKVRRVEPGALYVYRIDDGEEHADPASRHQPEGVHGPSQVIEPWFEWSTPDWSGLPLRDHVFYELHVGTFTEAGTFDGVREQLDHLESLGVTALQIMPVAQFPGERNWGYDGVFPYAVQHSYGGPRGLKRLVDACHARGIAVFLDVVYNHLGPEGCTLDRFGPYFTDRYANPWGRAINYDGPHSDEVRRYFIENALYWISEHRIDGLRLDAIHGIIDPTARPFLEELAESVHQEADRQRRRIHLIAENDRNDPRIVQPPDRGGHGLDGLWNQDFHAALHTLLTSDRKGIYRDFGTIRHLEKAFREGFVVSGQHSRYRKRRHGRSSREVAPHRMVVYAQNHDTVGNRAQGDRLTDLVSAEKLKLAAACIVFSPYLPLLFMGEEFGALTPFPYFIHHSDPDLVEAVREGRRRDFADFDWKKEFVDPQDPETFLSARLHHERREEGWHRAHFRFYRKLVRLRRGVPALAHADRENLEIRTDTFQQLLTVRSATREGEIFLYFHFDGSLQAPAIVPPPGGWETLVDSSAEEWAGPGNGLPDLVVSDGEKIEATLAPWSAVLLRRIGPGGSELDEVDEGEGSEMDAPPA
ncbi:MAG: malto-oligosyltrehalose trehalohydrolase [Gemmatimonadota bacterium]